MIVEFIKNDVPLNGKRYNKGDIQSVSSSIAKRLVDDEKSAKEFVEKKSKKVQESNSEK